jgi:hypothetical protein
LTITGDGAKIDLTNHTVQQILTIELDDCHCTFHSIAADKKKVILDTGVYTEVLSIDQNNVLAKVTQPNGQICMYSPMSKYSRKGCDRDRLEAIKIINYEVDPSA